MTSRAQRAVPWPRPLLLAALLLGIVTMNALGHPTESHASEDAPAAHSVASAGPPGPPGPPEPPGPPTDDEPDGTLTDPGSDCPAVLTGPAVPPPGDEPAGSRDTAPLGGADRVPVRSDAGPDPPSPDGPCGPRAPRALPDRPAVPRA
ncbi:hypothetical protein ACFXB3_13375 [Streptomyces sp. NPDC059447]|uniref:hypothetical protein n=1 Tax=Streptomyces sp. NPDC059447 TaxID=3346834 RepID=UPI0036785465